MSKIYVTIYEDYPDHLIEHSNLNKRQVLEHFMPREFQGGQADFIDSLSDVLDHMEHGDHAIISTTVIICKDK